MPNPTHPLDTAHPMIQNQTPQAVPVVPKRPLPVHVNKSATGATGLFSTALPWYFVPHAAGLKAAYEPPDGGAGQNTTVAHGLPLGTGIAELRRYRLMCSLHPTGRKVLLGTAIFQTIGDRKVTRVGVVQSLPLNAGEHEWTEAELEVRADALCSPRAACVRGCIRSSARGERRGCWERSVERLNPGATSSWSLLSGTFGALVAGDAPPQFDLWEEVELRHRDCIMRRISIPRDPLPGGVPAAAWLIAGPTVPPRVWILDQQGETLAFATVSRCYLRVAA
jgi:hypothetical protein